MATPSPTIGIDQRPPRDIAPRVFFEEWLPALYAAATQAGGWRPRPAVLRVRVVLDGEGGGGWDLVLEGGRLVVADAGERPADVPDVVVWQTVTDWRAMAAGEPGGVELVPPGGSALDLLFLDPTMRQLLDMLRGTVRFEVVGYNGRTWVLTARFGDVTSAPASPDAVISVDVDTWARMQARQLAPPEAFLSGRIRLQGNTGLAMQLGMTLLPRFAR